MEERNTGNGKTSMLTKGSQVSQQDDGFTPKLQQESDVILVILAAINKKMKLLNGKMGKTVIKALQISSQTRQQLCSQTLKKIQRCNTVEEHMVTHIL